jgi:hypothetical protein
MVGFSEQQKVAAISKVFTDSYKSPLSVIVVDNLERLLGESFRVHRTRKLRAEKTRLDTDRPKVFQYCIANTAGPFCSSAAKGWILLVKTHFR